MIKAANTDLHELSQAENDPEVLKAKINLETAIINWSELQRFFAAGTLFVLEQGHDLTQVALKMSNDNSVEIKKLIETNALCAVSDKQAIIWTERNPELWAVVVKPFILVQSIST